jgi:hypothetical protein
VAALGGVAVAALAAARPNPNQPVVVSGTLTYLWRGDVARGCAAAGVCATYGALSVQFNGTGDLTPAGHHGVLLADLATGVVRVADQSGECIDLVPGDFFAIWLQREAGRRYTATLEPTSASSGRCAGPLAGDLANIRLPAVRLGTRALGFDLHGGTHFAAGPFSGELVSTLELRPETSGGQGLGFGSSSSSSSSSGPPPRTPRPVLVEHADVRYRVTGATSALSTSFVGGPEPFCQPYNDCGTTGTLRLTVTGFRRTLQISASRMVHRRVSQSRALADLRAGRLTIDPSSGLFSVAAAGVTETIGNGGTYSCRDTIAERLPLAVNPFPFGAPRGAIPLLLGRGGGFSGGDPFRTHCPGPTATDITGAIQPGPGSLARALIDVRDLGNHEITVPVANAGKFSGLGYSGTRGGALVFRLSLLRAGGGSRRERLR